MSAVTLFLIVFSLPSRAFSDDDDDDDQRKELEQKVDILTEEVQRLKESLALPETDALKSEFGMGPAASKIYGATRGISLGGYGEFTVDAKVSDKRSGKDYNVGDFYRYIQYVGYKFTDRLLVNAEIEIEHATTGKNYADKSGSISIEFAYLEYLFHWAINLRAGILLIPSGVVNEVHEPPFYHGNLRPEVERTIIPSTWRELGVGLHGELVAGLSYKLYLVTGLNAAKFSEKGWRSGRQKGGRPIAESLAVIGRLDYRFRDTVWVGASLFYGGADQSRINDPDGSGELTSNTMLVEGHVQLRHRGLELRALGAYGNLSESRRLTRALFPDSGDQARPETRLIAARIYGYYVEAAYDFWPLLSRKPLYLAAYVRYERFNTQAGVPELPGRAADPTLDRTIVEAGLTFKPHSQVVVKLNYRNNTNAKGTDVADSVYVGAGFVY